MRGKAKQRHPPAAGRSSQKDHILPDILGEGVFGQGIFRDQVDFAPEQLLQVVLQPAEVEQGRVRLELGHEIDVAVGRLLHPGAGTEHIDLGGLVFSGNLIDFAPQTPEFVELAHGIRAISVMIGSGNKPFQEKTKKCLLVFKT